MKNDAKNKSRSEETSERKWGNYPLENLEACVFILMKVEIVQQVDSFAVFKHSHIFPICKKFAE